MRRVLISAAVSAWCVSCGGGDSPTCAEGFERADNDACDLVEPSDNGIPSGDTDDRDTDDDTEEDRENGSRHPRHAKPPVIYPPTLWLGRHATVPGFAHVIDAAYSEADNQFYVAGILH